jgi:hypothetical protein
VPIGLCTKRASSPPLQSNLQQSGSLISSVPESHAVGVRSAEYLLIEGLVSLWAHRSSNLCWSLRVDWLQVIAGCVSSHRVKSLEDLWSKLFSRSSFSNTLTKCSVKCPRGDKLFLSRVFVVYLLCGLISTS